MAKTSAFEATKTARTRVMRITPGEAERQLVFGVWIVCALVLATAATLSFGLVA